MTVADFVVRKREMESLKREIRRYLQEKKDVVNKLN